MNNISKMISLFIPIYNEEKIINENLNRILKITEGLNEKVEILLVDDGSSDDSGVICRKINGENIRYLRYNNGPSRRENLGISFKEARGEIIIFVDMDLFINVNYLRKVIDEINNGADIVIGSRYLNNSKIKRKFSRKIISYIYNYFIRFYFKSTVHDHQCGFKGFKKESVLDLIKDMGYDSSFKRGWFWDAELLIRAQRKGYKIVEFPIKWIYGKKSEFNIRRELKMIPYIWRLNGRLL